jgi:hypothetical protein
MLAVDSGFFEFLDDAGRAWLAAELKRDERYEVVMTTSGGLYRYRTGDRVLAEDGIGDIPSLRFIGRSGLVSDMTGEKLTDEFVGQCLEGIPGFRMLVPSAPMRAKPYYALVVDERASLDAERTAGRVEAALARNPQYAYARRMAQLDHLSVYFVSDPLTAYIERMVREGARMGEIKIPALRPETDWLGSFLTEAS